MNILSRKTIFYFLRKKRNILQWEAGLHGLTCLAGLTGCANYNGFSWLSWLSGWSTKQIRNDPHLESQRQILQGEVGENLKIEITSFSNWAENIRYKQILSCRPENLHEIQVSLAWLYFQMCAVLLIENIRCYKFYQILRKHERNHLDLSK